MTTAKDLADMANDALEEQSVEELMYAAEEAIVDNDASAGDLVHKPSGDAPFGMRVDEVLSAGHVWVYDIRNGDRSRINKNNLQVQLGKRDPETGKRVFTTDKNYPGMPKPVVGQFKCILHKDDPNRAEYTRMGFPVCRKSNLMSPSEVENHARNRHQQEWRQIKEAETREREERRAKIEELQLNRLLAESGTAPAPTVAPEPAVQPVQEAVSTIESPEEFRTCPECDEWTNDNPKVASRRMSYFHHKKKHEG
jgi:hypothetical protein